LLLRRDEAQHFTGQSQGPPARPPGQQQLAQTLQTDAIDARITAATRQPLQAPGADLCGQAEHSGRPEAGMRQRRQSLATDTREQQGPGSEEGQTGKHLQEQAEQEGGALLQIQRQPENQQARAAPHGCSRHPGQHEQYGQVDEHQAHQHHHRQGAEQPAVLANLRVARRQQHAGDQPQTDNRRRQQAEPAGAEATTSEQRVQRHLPEEQQPTEQLHGEGAVDETRRRDAQADEQGHQPRQRPGDGRAGGLEQQRCDQIEKRQAGDTEPGQQAIFPGVGRFGHRPQLPVAEQQRRTEHQRAQRRAIEQAFKADVQTTDEGQGRAHLQQQGESSCQRSALTQAQPVDAGALHGPGRRRPARIEAKWDGQAGEHDAERQASLHQQQCAVASARLEHPCQQQIEETQAEGAERRGELDMPYQRHLQTEADQWRAEQRGGIDIVTTTQRPAQQFVTRLGRIRRVTQGAAGEQQADAHVHQEEQDQERFGAP